MRCVLTCRLFHLTHVYQKFAGDKHTVVATDTGGFVWGFGSSDSGQIGLASGSSSTPSRIEALDGMSTVSVGCGDIFTVSLQENGTVFTFGGADANRLGAGSTSKRHQPKQVAGLPVITHIAVGRAHVLVRSKDAETFIWGQDSGVPPAPGPLHQQPVTMKTLAPNIRVQRSNICRNDSSTCQLRHNIGTITTILPDSTCVHVSWDNGNQGMYDVAAGDLVHFDIPHTSTPAGSTALRRVGELENFGVFGECIAASGSLCAAWFVFMSCVCSCIKYVTFASGALRRQQPISLCKCLYASTTSKTSPSARCKSGWRF